MKNDDSYANAAHIPGGDTWFEIWEDKARQFRTVEAAIGRARLNLPYGADERERFDLFHPAGRAHGLIVFVHGGFWLSFGREYFSHLAAGLAARGFAVAMPSYPLAPEVEIPAITRSIARAIDTAAALVAGPVVLSGHSAGGHLVARMMCPDVGLATATLARIKRVVPISPLGDLRPLLDTAMNDTLRLTDQTAISESPALIPDPRQIDGEIWVGADERPAFIQQAETLHQAWPATRLVIDPRRHHFDIIDGLEQPHSQLTGALVKGLI